MAQTKQPQLNEPGTSGNDGAPVGRKTKQSPQDGKAAHAGSNGTGAATAGRPGGAGGR